MCCSRPIEPLIKGNCSIAITNHLLFASAVVLVTCGLVVSVICGLVVSVTCCLVVCLPERARDRLQGGHHQVSGVSGPDPAAGSGSTHHSNIQLHLIIIILILITRSLLSSSLLLPSSSLNTGRPSYLRPKLSHRILLLSGPHYPQYTCAPRNPCALLFTWTRTRVALYHQKPVNCNIDFH